MCLTAHWTQKDIGLINQKTCQYKIIQTESNSRKQKIDEIIRKIWNMHRRSNTYITRIQKGHKKIEKEKITKYFQNQENYMKLQIQVVQKMSSCINSNKSKHVRVNFLKPNMEKKF